MLGVVFAVRDPHRLPEQMAIHFQFLSYHMQEEMSIFRIQQCRKIVDDGSPIDPNGSDKQRGSQLGCLRDRVGVYLAFLTPSIFQSTNAENGVYCKLKLLLLPLTCSPPLAAVCPPNA